MTSLFSGLRPLFLAQPCQRPDTRAAGLFLPGGFAQKHLGGPKLPLRIDEYADSPVRVSRLQNSRFVARAGHDRAVPDSHVKYVVDLAHVADVLAEQEVLRNGRMLVVSRFLPAWLKCKLRTKPSFS